jgi:hypothetical protein
LRARSPVACSSTRARSANASIPNSAKRVVGYPQLHPCVESSALASQPLAVEEMSPREVQTKAGWLQTADRVAVQSFGCLPLLEERPRTRLDALRPRGFERVVVLGVRLGDSPEQGREKLARLLEHHLHSRAGLALVQQGTPTNNTEQDGAGYSFREDSDATFDVFMREQAQYDPLEPDPFLRRDGHWLAELVGLPHELVQRIPNASASDQSDARAMQIALWPGTLGYTLGSPLAPVFSDEDIAFVRGFFTRYVTGRGPLPALRIGRQPYGILPTTAFGRVDWFDRLQAPKVQRLYEILKRINDDWKPLVDQVSHIGKRGDPHQILIDVLGLHPNSAEFHPLQSESIEHKFYELSFFNFSMALGFLDRFPPVFPMALLRTFGYTGEEVPDLLNKLFKGRQTPLTGPLIDDRPLSERDEIRRYAGEGNYIDWLADAAEEGIEALQQELGFDGGRPPTALLYLLLRHALQLAFRETALQLETEAGLLENASPMRREPAFVHVSDAAESSESGYELLFRAEERITGSAGLRMGDYIARNIHVVAPDLSEHVQALRRLARLPTAKLERAFAEHIDCCAYRLFTHPIHDVDPILRCVDELRRFEPLPPTPATPIRAPPCYGSPGASRFFILPMPPPDSPAPSTHTRSYLRNPWKRAQTP